LPLLFVFPRDVTHTSHLSTSRSGTDAFKTIASPARHVNRDSAWYLGVSPRDSGGILRSALETRLRAYVEVWTPNIRECRGSLFVPKWGDGRLEPAGIL